VSALTSIPGIVALAAAGVAVVALVLAIVVAVKVRRLSRAQRIVLGEEEQDLVAHAAALHEDFDRLAAEVEQASIALHERVVDAERRLDGAITYRSLIRYDAYNEMSGRQSTSIALLDASRSGVVLSSIHHRDQARLYAKRINGGDPELELSPEEAEAVRQALEPEEQRATASGR
jgi:Na+-transporting methylmalonyl-CoA/oxaloacetate decarboxylase gamma subunit